MPNDPIDSVYSYVERAYIRLQAGDWLSRCVEDGNITPIQQVVENFVLAGPQSISALREILAETEQRKSQLRDDLNGIYAELENNLKSYGVSLRQARTPAEVIALTPVRFLNLLREQDIAQEDQQIMCLELLRDSKELMLSLVDHLHLLEEAEQYLNDWLWGLAYQSAHQKPSSPNHPESSL